MASSGFTSGQQVKLYAKAAAGSALATDSAATSAAVAGIAVEANHVDFVDDLPAREQTASLINFTNYGESQSRQIPGIPEQGEWEVAINLDASNDVAQQFLGIAAAGNLPVNSVLDLVIDTFTGSQTGDHSYEYARARVASISRESPKDAQARLRVGFAIVEGWHNFGSS